MQEKGNRDNAEGKSYGNGISMVCRCGQKSNGEEVAVSLGYALGLRTDQTTSQSLMHVPLVIVVAPSATSIPKIFMPLLASPLLLLLPTMPLFVSPCCCALVCIPLIVAAAHGAFACLPPHLPFVVVIAHGALACLPLDIAPLLASLESGYVNATKISVYGLPAPPPSP